MVVIPCLLKLTENYPIHGLHTFYKIQVIVKINRKNPDI